jgi:hypothetical protein
LEAEPRPFCSTCGLPIAGAVCGGCGGTALPLALADGVAGSAVAYAPDAVRPELELAEESFKAGDMQRVLSQCLAAAGVGALTTKAGLDGPEFKGMWRGISIFARLRPGAGDVTVEAPVVRLPLTQYVPSLRLLLELSDDDRGPIRYSVRGELIMARFTASLAGLTPSSLYAAIGLCAVSAADCARVLVGAMQAREVTEAEHAALTVEAIPRGVLLTEEVPTSSMRAFFKESTPPPRQPTRELLGAARPTPVAEVPAILMPPAGLAGRKPAAPAAAPAPTRPASERPPMPSALGPTPGRPGGAPAALRTPGAKPTPMAQPAVAAPTAGAASPKPPPVRPLGAALRPPQREPERPREEHTPPTAPSPEVSPASRAARPAPPAPLAEPPAPPRAGSRHPELLELLHKAQTLGAVLSFADQPATMCLLIRATVYRTILEHEASAPGAAAHLYESAAAVTKEIYITAPGKRRGAMSIPPTAPAFEAMAEIVSKEGVVQAQAPLTITPITSAQEAKQHLARYVSEIEQAPSDVDLRHFLALGALSELLVRAKLPAPTHERLKGILGHARKEGPKQAVVDLMMTALNRMIA